MDLLNWVLIVICTVLLGSTIGLAVGKVEVNLTQYQSQVQQVYQIQESANLSLVGNRLYSLQETNGTNYFTHIYLPEAVLLLSITNNITNIVTNWATNSFGLRWGAR